MFPSPLNKFLVPPPAVICLWYTSCYTLSIFTSCVQLCASIVGSLQACRYSCTVVSISAVYTVCHYWLSCVSISEYTSTHSVHSVRVGVLCCARTAHNTLTALTSAHLWCVSTVVTCRVGMSCAGKVHTPMSVWSPHHMDVPHSTVCAEYT